MNGNPAPSSNHMQPEAMVVDAPTLNNKDTAGLEQHFVQPTQPVDQIDPHAFLRLQMRVVGGQSKTLGKVVTLERESSTGQLTALIVRHGLLGNKLTSVPREHVKWVNRDSVVLQLSRTAFRRLPQLAGR